MYSECFQKAHRSGHPWTVVLLPNPPKSVAALFPEHATCCGRTWLIPTPAGKNPHKVVTVVTPTEAIPEGNFELLLCGWGHTLSEEERNRTQEWRKAAGITR